VDPREPFWYEFVLHVETKLLCGEVFNVPLVDVVDCVVYEVFVSVYLYGIEMCRVLVTGGGMEWRGRVAILSRGRASYGFCTSECGK
jgi:hypothetical protein